MRPPSPVEVPKYLTFSLIKYARLEASRSKGIQLVVKKSETMTPNLIVHRVAQDDKSVHMAFAFILNKKIYYPVINMDSLTNEVRVKIEGPLEKTYNHFTKMYLFSWDGNEEYGSLRSVVEPKQYLSVSQGQFITLSSEPDPNFRFSDSVLS